MNSSSHKHSLTMAVSLLFTLLTALATLGGTDFFFRSIEASANGSGRKTAATSPAATTTPDKASQASVAEAYGKLPMSFEANRGQTDARVKFLARGNGYNLFLTSSEAVLSLNKPMAHETGAELSVARRSDRASLAGRGRAQQDVLRMKLLGANSTSNMVGLEELPGKSNYLIGRAPEKWRTDVAHYAKVKYEAVYRGVDMVYYGNQRQLEYDFIVAPGASPSSIRLAFEGAQDIKIDAGGDLILQTRGGLVRQLKPVIYQETDGERREVAGRYVKRGKRQVGFEVGVYDVSRPLVIDPVLAYSTYLGGSGGDIGFGIAVDAAGNAYVAGYTASTDFPTTGGSFQPAHAGGTNDAFVTKLNATGSALVYSTYLGGSSTDHGYAIAINAAGQAYVVGDTNSSDFPTTPGAFDTTDNVGGEAFVAKLNASGSALVYSTYLGGNGNETARGIAIDGAGNAYVAGYGSATDFPTTPGAFDTSYNGGGSDVLVTKLDADGAALVYSTYLGGNGGGTGSDLGLGIAVDASGSAYVTGYTLSPDFPTTPGSFDTSYNGDRDGFVTKLNTTGTSLVYSTFLGGSALDTGFGIAVDGGGYAYITGEVASANFPTTAGAFDTSINGSIDAFVTKLDASGASLAYSTYLGGSVSDATDLGESIAVDASGYAYVTGFTDSPDFPMTPDAFDTSHNGNLDGFVTKLNFSGSALVYSTYLGGTNRDGGRGIAVDGAGNAYVAGETFSPDFPTTAGAFDTSYNGHFDVFVAKVSAPPASPGQIIISEFRLQGTTADDEFIELYNNTDAPIDILNYQLTINETLPRSTSFALGTPGPSVIPPRGHYLVSHQTGYTLGSYAAGDITYSLGFNFTPDAGITLHNTANVLLDKVGFTTSPAGSCEGTCLTPTSATGQYSFARRMETGPPKDSNNNAADFILVATDPAPFGGAARLGAPGPENSTSPLPKLLPLMPGLLIDPTVASSASPNRTRDTTPYADVLTPSGPDGNTATPYALGTLSVQRRVLNNTGQPVTRLRFRVIDVTTLGTPYYVSGTQADVRVLSSNGTTRAPSAVPPGVSLKGVTLEQSGGQMSQSKGGGWNSSLAAGTITMANPLPANDDPSTPNVVENALDVQFLLGVASSGTFRFYVIVEALP